MTKYIPLDAVLAEIEKLVDLRKFKTDYDSGYRNGGNAALNNLKERINTLKAKEVGLPNFEQEVKDFCYGFDDRKEAWYKMTPHDQNLMVSPTFANFAMQLAKHFFELGLKASNPIAEENIESFVRQVIDLDIEAGEYYNNIIEEERKENGGGGSDLMINLLCGTIDAKELGIQYVLDKLKAQKGE